MRLPGIVLALSALPFAGVGAFFLLAPATAGGIVGLELTDVTADNDVRAVYGGLGLGLAAFLALAARREAWHRPALTAQVLTYGGLALARVLSWAVAGWPGPVAFLLHGGEIVGVCFGVFALRRLPASK